MPSIFLWLERAATSRRLVVLLVLEVVVLFCENALDFPLSVPFMRRTTGHPYLDMCAFCSAAQINAQLDDFGMVGRRLQLLLMPTIDVVIPVLSCAFGSVALTVLLRAGGRMRWRWVRLLPLLAMVLDFAENGGIIALVTAYPTRLNATAALTGLLTGLKFCAYLSTVVALAVLAVASFRDATRKRPPQAP
jgi:hypothetical protein